LAARVKYIPLWEVPARLAARCAGVPPLTLPYRPRRQHVPFAGTCFYMLPVLVWVRFFLAQRYFVQGIGL